VNVVLGVPAYLLERDGQALADAAGGGDDVVATARWQRTREWDALRVEVPHERDLSVELAARAPARRDEPEIADALVGIIDAKGEVRAS
jgi:alkyl hydroperoxide reductase subunit AhpC